MYEKNRPIYGRFVQGWNIPLNIFMGDRNFTSIRIQSPFATNILPGSSTRKKYAEYFVSISVFPALCRGCTLKRHKKDPGRGLYVDALFIQA